MVKSPASWEKELTQPKLLLAGREQQAIEALS
jgi:hypothetical protein